MEQRHIKIEGQTVMGNKFTTYFVDLVESGSHGNLRSFENITEARQYAREYADAHGLRVVDETYAPEVMGRFRARGEAMDIIYRAAASAATANAKARVQGGA